MKEIKESVILSEGVMIEIIYPLICMPANVVITPGAGVTMKISYNI